MELVKQPRNILTCKFITKERQEAEGLERNKAMGKIWEETPGWSSMLLSQEFHLWPSFSYCPESSVKIHRERQSGRIWRGSGLPWQHNSISVTISAWFFFGLPQRSLTLRWTYAPEPKDDARFLNSTVISSLLKRFSMVKMQHNWNISLSLPEKSCHEPLQQFYTKWQDICRNLCCKASTFNDSGLGQRKGKKEMEFQIMWENIKLVFTF